MPWHAKTLLGALQMPFAAIPGNHDRRIQMRKAFPDPAYTADGAINAMRSVGELDVLLINSTVPAAPHGELDAATVAWLVGALATSPVQPVLLFLHATAQTVFAGVSATICPEGEQAVTLEFEPRPAGSLQDRAPNPPPARVAPWARDSEAWSPIVCQSANFLVLIFMAMPISATALIMACFNPPTRSLFLR